MRDQCPELLAVAAREVAFVELVNALLALPGNQGLVAELKDNPS